MRRDHDVVKLGIDEDLQARLGKLGAHDDRDKAADETGRDGQHDVHRADIPVVGGIDPATPAGRTGVGVRGALRMLNMRSEEHTSELQSPMRISYAVSRLNKKKKQHKIKDKTHH